MSDPRITQLPSDTADFVFKVELPKYTYRVKVPRDYYQELTGGKITPEELVKKSFAFLLERESAGSILPKFDLPLIGHYFPEYEQVITRNW